MEISIDECIVFSRTTCNKKGHEKYRNYNFKRCIQRGCIWLSITKNDYKYYVML